MARPLRITYPGAFYHETSQGYERKDVFKSKRDREKFLEYFESATKRYNAVIHVFCLMDNHYHLLLETPSGNLPQIMQHINGAYTTYFNVKRGRFGHLFQGRYKAILVDIDEYAKELSRYIHLNPVRANWLKLRRNMSGRAINLSGSEIMCGIGFSPTATISGPPTSRPSPSYQAWDYRTIETVALR